VLSGIPKRLTMLLHKCYLTVKQLKVVIHKSDMVIHLTTLDVSIDIMVKVFLVRGVLFVLTQLVCVSPLHVPCLYWVRRTMFLRMDRFTFFDTTSLVTLLEKFASRYCGRGCSCTVVFLCVVFRGVGMCTFSRSLCSVNALFPQIIYLLS
jgi:hypothetical protein